MPSGSFQFKGYDHRYREEDMAQDILRELIEELIKPCTVDNGMLYNGNPLDTIILYCENIVIRT